MLLAPAATRHVVVTDVPQSIPVSLTTLGVDELRALERLVEVVQAGPESTLVRRNRRHNVGRCVAGGWTFSVPPAFDAEILLGLVLYAYRVDLELVQRAKLVSAPLMKTSGIDLFLQMMGAIVISEARQIAARHVAQVWEPVVERSHNPKGRILWRADFGRHPGEGVTHFHRLKTTDNGLNRLILAGVRAASAGLRDTVLRGDANRQEFVWGELASDIRPRSSDFDVAHRGLNRMTEHYATALAISRALVLGLTPSDYFAAGRDPLLPALEFNLPSIFERFMERLLREVASSYPAHSVAAQAPDRSALIDEEGRTYRQVRPDLELLIRGTPVAVVDAKFKPRYVASDGTQKVSTADVYQLLFYQARATQRSLGRVVRTAIVAPQLGTDAAPEGWPREIIWRHEGTMDHRVSLIPVPLGALLTRLRRESALAALDVAPELRVFLDREWLSRSASLPSVMRARTA